MQASRSKDGLPKADRAQRPITKSLLFFRPHPLLGGSGFDTILTSEGRLLKRRFSVPVVIAAVAVIPLLVLEEQFPTGTAQTWLHVIDWLIWGVFAVEMTVMLIVTPNRKAYLRCAWLDVCIVVLTLPLLPYLLAFLRLGRLGRLIDVLRLLRLLRLAAIANRAGATIQRIFGTFGLGYLLSSVVALVIVSGVLFSHLEDGYSVSEGVWWAIVTATSVGYGDVVPASGLGRLVATLLMVAGISFVALLSAATAAYLVDIEGEEEQEDLLQRIREQQNREQKIQEQLHEVNDRLQHLETLLSSGREPGGAPAREPGPPPD